MQNQTRFVFRQSAIYSVGNILSKLSGVLLIPLYLKYISEEEFGVVSLFETIAQFIMILSGWGIRAGFSRWYYEFKSRMEQKQLFFTAYSFNLISSFLAVLVIGGILFFFSSAIFKTNISSDIILYFSLGTLFRLLFDIPFFMLRIQQKAAQQTGWFSLNVVLVLLFTFVFLEFFDMGLKGIYLGQMVAHFFTFVPMIPLIWRNFSFKFRYDVLQKLLQYGLPLAISNILTTVLTLSDRHIINQYQNLSEVAGYSMAFKISNLIQVVVVASIITGFTNYYFKTLHSGNSTLFYQRIVRYFTVLITLGGLGIVLFSPEIIYVVSMGSAFFQTSVIIVPVLMLGMIFSGLRQLFTLPLNKHKRTRKISMILIVSAVINVAGNFVLVPWIGKMGASISTVVAQLFALIWFLSEAGKVEEINFSPVRNILLLVIWSLMVWGGMQLFALPFFSGLILKLGVVAVFVVILFLTGHISRDELKEAKSLYRSLRQR
ncbi:polysaccharide biosynthesis C-terminal domain-containing protein [Marinilabilia salmonicolor]|jgi:O-antigen/teichoic acid export membrane protein|uniref:O-antigen/teichoic acid export membrane protein n=1 Tax=Marinilabilia salmonicolor TaxID=989 RepID=A0A2T0XS62_9BACT|nr:polysaccharide biosynthesis C-terminal domain-containing protein [Marinilabilia salmonicolor]PRZ01780.1 O-antigen/teichoic acid export membrane protein [Marinilabilia salmonicolor]RCW31355.1 O-antigen/teichoic acid export membrane protein [Marinilabilia salmonicolor]